MKILFILLSALVGAEYQAIDCEPCKAFVESARSVAEFKPLQDLATEIGLAVCLLIVKEEFGVCKGAVYEMAQPVLQSVISHYLDPEFVCYSLNACSSPKFIRENFTEWENALLSTNQTVPPPSPTYRDSYTFGHLADVHFDFYYSEGSNGNCGQPVCCRDWLGPGNAGKFGDYNCDIPIHTFEAALEQLAAKKPDFVLWTGDTPPHDVWNQSREYQNEFQKVSSELLQKYFPSTPVYGIFGNHGSYPVNVYNPKDENWLLGPFAEYFGYWLPDSAKSTIQEMGTFSVLHKDTNLRLIAINTQACNNMNWFLFANVTDPNGQIKWIIQELEGAESRNEKVYIFGHIPLITGDCLDAWAAHLNSIVTRFSNTIINLFYGHTHSDQFALMRDVRTSEPINTQWIAPSVTTYTNKNPSFRIYEADSDSKVVVDIHQYRLDLTKANQVGQAVYEKAYSMKSEYNLTDLSPQSIDQFVETMKINEDVALRWVDNRGSGGPSVPKSCNEGCRFGVYCDTKWGTNKEQDACHGYTPSTQDKAMALLFGPWTYKQYD